MPGLRQLVEETAAKRSRAAPLAHRRSAGSGRMKKAATPFAAARTAAA